MGSLSGYGEDYEFPLSAAKAKKVLVGMKLAPDLEAAKSLLPRMGWERDVKRVPVDLGEARLVLQNICGSYVLATTYGPRDCWEHTFGIRVENL